MDATCKVQDNIHVFRLVHNICPGFWVHINERMVLFLLGTYFTSPYIKINFSIIIIKTKSSHHLSSPINQTNIFTIQSAVTIQSIFIIATGTLFP